MDLVLVQPAELHNLPSSREPPWFAGSRPGRSRCAVELKETGLALRHASGTASTVLSMGALACSC